MLFLRVYQELPVQLGERDKTLTADILLVDQYDLILLLRLAYSRRCLLDLRLPSLYREELAYVMLLHYAS